MLMPPMKQQKPLVGRNDWLPDAVNKLSSVPSGHGMFGRFSGCGHDSHSADPSLARPRNMSWKTSGPHSLTNQIQKPQNVSGFVWDLITGFRGKPSSGRNG